MISDCPHNIYKNKIGLIEFCCCCCILTLLSLCPVGCLKKINWANLNLILWIQTYLGFIVFILFYVPQTAVRFRVPDYGLLPKEMIFMAREDGQCPFCISPYKYFCFLQQMLVIWTAQVWVLRVISLYIFAVQTDVSRCYFLFKFNWAYLMMCLFLSHITDRLLTVLTVRFVLQTVFYAF